MFPRKIYVQPFSSKGPLPKTYRHFWQMVWEQRVQVIVMTTRTFERGRQKCGQYWPTGLLATNLLYSLFYTNASEAGNENWPNFLAMIPYY